MGVLVGFVQRNIRPDLILFADVGGEKDETYAYLPTANQYLRHHGLPEITTVRYGPKNFKNWPPYYTLEQNCLTNGTLPSISFNFQFKSCSKKWKADPQHAYIKRWQPAIDCWSAGGRVRKVIGYDNSPADRKRRTYACDPNKVKDDGRYDYWYPLIEWGWSRERCKLEIQRVGLPVPPKSSCFFCAAMQPEEIEALPAEKLCRIVVLEARAKPRFRTIKGLWGTGTKERSGSITEFIRKQKLLPADVIERLQREVPGEIVAYQQRHALGEKQVAFGEYVTQLVQIQERVA
jgi:hypothetical protein